LSEADVAERDRIRSTEEEDKAIESAVLQHILALHPTAITFEEMARELGAGADSFADRDALERAVRDLRGTGLLQRSDPLLLPSRAALRFDELLGD
jgi:hypothetical protein